MSVEGRRAELESRLAAATREGRVVWAFISRGYEAEFPSGYVRLLDGREIEVRETSGVLEQSWPLTSDLYAVVDGHHDELVAQVVDSIMADLARLEATPARPKPPPPPAPVRLNPPPEDLPRRRWWLPLGRRRGSRTCIPRP